MSIVRGEPWIGPQRIKRNRPENGAHHQEEHYGEYHEAVAPPIEQPSIGEHQGEGKEHHGEGVEKV